ncbi:MAG: nuclear transport factor 2 family protein [Mycobacteriales bacterium]
MTLPAVASAFLTALQERDVPAVLRCLHDDATYAYAVPLPALRGKDAIGAMLKELLDEAEAVRWDVVAASLDGERLWWERVDRFWFDGREVAIECAGVVEVRDGLIAELRDYVDLQTWRERKGAAA